MGAPVWGGAPAGCVGGVIDGGAIIGGHMIENPPVIGGTKVIETEKKETEKKEPEKLKEPEKKDENMAKAAPAKLIVNVPADAKLTIDGVVTTSTSSRRVFVSPTLEAGKAFRYTLTAEITHQGNIVVVTKDARVKAGQTTEVSLQAADLAGVAAR